MNSAKPIKKHDQKKESHDSKPLFFLVTIFLLYGINSGSSMANPGEKIRRPASEIVKALGPKEEKFQEPGSHTNKDMDSSKTTSNKKTKVPQRKIAQNTNEPSLGNQKKVTLAQCRALSDEALARHFINFVAWGGLLGSNRTRCEREIQGVPIYMIQPLSGDVPPTLFIVNDIQAIKIESVTIVRDTDGSDSLERKIKFQIQSPRGPMEGEVSIFRSPPSHPDTTDLDPVYEEDVRTFGCVLSHSPIKIQDKDFAMFVLRYCLR